MFAKRRERFAFRYPFMRKTQFLSHLYIKTIILPRQARDKHRKNSKKMPFSRFRYPFIVAPEGIQVVTLTFVR